ncbi:hypothetical protein [Haladaptatus sp. NG-WS-4]
MRPDIFVVVVVLLAGCTGGAEMPDNASPDGPGADSATITDDATFTPFVFDNPATYTYEIRDQREGSGQLVWDVQSVEGNQITIHSVFTFEGETTEKTLTFERDDALAEIGFSPGGRYAITTMFSPSMSGVYDKDLQGGQTWTAVSGKGSMEYDVTEK